MPYLFDHLDEIREFLPLHSLGLITDIDGTISEIAPSPGEARVSSICQHYLALLSRQLKLVAVISGRPASEARSMVGIDEVIYIGNHGLEWWENGEVILRSEAKPYTALIKAILQQLSPLLAAKGISFDNKGVSASIHYRRCPDRRAAREVILDAIASVPAARELQKMEGRLVVDLRPPLKWNKGSTVLDLAQRYHLQGVLCLGDDITDIDAFRTLRTAPLKGISIGVVSEEMPPRLEMEADYTVRDVGDVERFLGWLEQVVIEATSTGHQVDDKAIG
jgi:trehalose 6-phosphate phosphatase